MSERTDEQGERVKERDGEGKEKKSGHVQDERKKRSGGVCPCLRARFFLTAGIKHDIFGEKTAQRGKHEAVSSPRDGCSEETTAQRDHG